MRKPDLLLPPPTPETDSTAISEYQTGPVSQVVNIPPATPTPAARPTETGGDYVDPYLFETGYYASWDEYQELTRTALDRVQFRADVENAPPKRRK